MSKTKIFAHRGASGYAPENTLEAFALAITQGADGIELDVQLTKDGIPVVIHDETIDRVTEKTGFVKDYTLNELKELTVLGNKFPEYSSSKIPTLEEVLDAVIPKYINSVIYGGMMDAVASENGARMTAMDNATSNAEDMIENLTLSYNRARQGAITQEITEIVSGAEALK